MPDRHLLLNRYPSFPIVDKIKGFVYNKRLPKLSVKPPTLLQNNLLLCPQVSFSESANQDKASIGHKD